MTASTTAGKSSVPPISTVARGTIVHVRERSDQLFFVYTGVLRGLMVDPIDFSRHTQLMDRNVVFFQDVRRLYYQRGVSTQINTFDAFVDWQQSLQASLTHVRRVFCLGTSAGAYAALLCGHRLRAEEVWAFAPQTVPSRNPTDVPHLPPEAPADHGDLALVLGRSNGISKYNVYYNENFEVDRRAAERIAHCDGVRLWPQPGDGHNVVSVLLTQGLLPELLPPTSQERLCAQEGE